MAAQVRRTTTSTVQKSRIVRQNVVSRINKLLSAALFQPKQNRFWFMPFQFAQFGGIGDSLKYATVATTNGFVNCIFEANSAIPISSSVKPGQHFQLEVFIT